MKTETVLSEKKIDQLAERRNTIETEQEKLDKELELVDQEILACVEAQGNLAERSSKMRMVPGKIWELRAIYGQETRVDQNKAREFTEACDPEFAAQVFRREVKLVLVQSPDRLLGGAELPIATRRLFQEAVQVKPRSPKVEVKSRLAKTAKNGE
jgi:hypothetical protein